MGGPLINSQQEFPSYLKLRQRNENGLKRIEEGILFDCFGVIAAQIGLLDRL